MNQENQKIGTCALCKSGNTVLRESHIIPKFVSDWVKETSKTGYLRLSDDVNKRHQDGQKEYLLCDGCEGILSVMEKEIAEDFFKKIANYRQQKSEIKITENMRIGVLSIFWRALETSKARENDWTSEDKEKINIFLEKIRVQIIENRCETNIYFALFFGTPPYYALPPEMTYNIERASGSQDIRFFDDPHRFSAVFKIPFSYFYIFSDGWDAGEIDKSIGFAEGKIKIDAINKISNILTEYIFRDHDFFIKSKSEMSKENLDKIKKDSDKNKNITGSDKSIQRSGL